MCADQLTETGRVLLVWHSGYSVDKMPPRLSFDPNVTQADLHQYFFPGKQTLNFKLVRVIC